LIPWRKQPPHDLLYGMGIRCHYDRWAGSVSFFKEGWGELWIYYPSMRILWFTIKDKVSSYVTSH